MQHKQIQKNKKVNCTEFDQSPNGLTPVIILVFEYDIIIT